MLTFLKGCLNNWQLFLFGTNIWQELILSFISIIWVYESLTYFYFAAWHPSSAVHSLQCDGVKLSLVEVHHGYFCCLVLRSLWGTKNKLEVIPVKNSQINFYAMPLLYCSIYCFYSLCKVTKWHELYFEENNDKEKKKI